jgi:hypothetical protein
MFVEPVIGFTPGDAAFGLVWRTPNKSLADAGGAWFHLVGLPVGAASVSLPAIQR